MGYKAVWESYFHAENNIFLSVSQRNARRLMKYVKKAIKDFEVMFGEKIVLTLDNKDEIQFKNGGLILSLPNNPDTAVGESGNLNIDEASRFKNSEEIMDAVYPFISRGHKLRITSTPLGQRGLFWEFNKKSLEENNKWSRYSINIDRAISDGCPISVEDIKGDMDEISFRQNYMCEFLDDGIAFFSYELILATINHDLKNLTLNELAKKRTLLIAGYDPGKLVDSGVFTIITKDFDDTIKLLHVKEFKQIDYSEQIAYCVQYVLNLGISRLYVDATGVGVKIHEDLVKSLGSIAKPIVYTNSVKEQLVTDLKLAMERKTIQLPDDSRLIDQLHGIERDVLPSGNTRYKHSEKDHDDIVMSMCNALSHFSSRRKIDLNEIVIGKPSVFNNVF